MDYVITTGHVPPQTIVSIRARRPLDDVPAFIKGAFADLFGRLGLLGVSPSGPPFVIYHEFGANGIDAEVSVPIDQSVAAAGKAESRVLPAATVARTIHVGPYEELGEAYSAVSDWIRDHGYEVAGAMQERYLNGPGDHVTPSEYQTEIGMPIVALDVAAPVRAIDDGRPTTIADVKEEARR